MNRFCALVHDRSRIQHRVVHLSLAPFRSEDWPRIDHLCTQTHKLALLTLTPVARVIDSPFSTLLASSNLFFFDYILALLVPGINQQLHQIAKAKHGHIIVGLLTLPIKSKASKPQ
jgi:hypothetical protein